MLGKVSDLNLFIKTEITISKHDLNNPESHPAIEWKELI